MNMDTHNGLIDLYRILFIYVISSFHAKWIPGQSNVLFIGGYVAVEFFFILSGFLLSMSAWKKENTDELSIALDTINEIKKRVIHMWYYFIPAFLSIFCISHLGIKEYGIDFGFRVIKDLILSIFELLFLSMAGFISFFSLYDPPVWYFSVLLIAILLIYPLMRKAKMFFPAVIAPIIVLISYGFLSVHYGSVNTITEWHGVIYTGLIRGIGGVCLGCICFHLVRVAPIEKKTKLSYIKNTCLEVAILIVTLLLMCVYNGYKTDFIAISGFTILIYLSFAKDSYLNKICNNRFLKFLGEYAMAIFVTHWLAVCFLAKNSGWVVEEDVYLIYIFCVFISSAIDLILARLIKKILPPPIC